MKAKKAADVSVIDFNVQFRQALELMENIYRQKDDDFIRLLNAIRNRTVTDEERAAYQGNIDHVQPRGSSYFTVSREI